MKRTLLSEYVAFRFNFESLWILTDTLLNIKETMTIQSLELNNILLFSTSICVSKCKTIYFCDKFEVNNVYINVCH